MAASEAGNAVLETEINLPFSETLAEILTSLSDVEEFVETYFMPFDIDSLLKEYETVDPELTPNDDIAILPEDLTGQHVLMGLKCDDI